MRNWQGIRQDTAITENDGAFDAINPSYYTDGQITRRLGMSAFDEQSGVLIAPFWSALAGYQIAFATPTGEIVILEADA